jgi:hypothetical protein
LYDKTPGEIPAWMIELPDDPGKAYAYAEDRAKSPDKVVSSWYVWECEKTEPIEKGQWEKSSAFIIQSI